MPVITVTLPADGGSANAASVDTPLTTIVNLLNGGLDHDNMVDGGITGAKLAAATVTPDKLTSSTLSGWAPLSQAPNTVAALGNRSYNLTFSGIDFTSILSPGMRLKLTRSVAAPSQCTLLNGTSQYFSRASASLTGLSFTDTFTCSAWVKLTSYAAAFIISRRTAATSGWDLEVSASGQIQILGLNASSYRGLFSTQALPLNKWVHVAGAFQMSTNSGALYIDGIAVPSTAVTSGSPTSLIQSGDLCVGSQTSGGSAWFPGEIAQAAVYSAVLTSSTILAAATQTLAGTETNLVSAYSFNGVITDLNRTNANDLTANSSAVATQADSPFAQGATAGLLEYGIIQSAALISTNTVLTVQAPEGSAIPTSGGISAASYATVKDPYLFPLTKQKWTIVSRYLARASKLPPANLTAYNLGGEQITVPIGAWRLGYRGQIYEVITPAGTNSVTVDLNTGAITGPWPSTTGATVVATSELACGNYINPVTDYSTELAAETSVTVATATQYWLNAKTSLTGTPVNLSWLHDFSAGVIYAENAYL